MTAFYEVLKISFVLAAVGAVLILAVTAKEHWRRVKAVGDSLNVTGEEKLNMRRALPLTEFKSGAGTANLRVTRTREIKKLKLYQKLNNKKAEITPKR